MFVSGVLKKCANLISHDNKKNNAASKEKENEVCKQNTSINAEVVQNENNIFDNSNDVIVIHDSYDEGWETQEKENIKNSVSFTQKGVAPNIKISPASPEGNTSCQVDGTFSGTFYVEDSLEDSLNSSAEMDSTFQAENVLDCNTTNSVLITSEENSPLKQTENICGNSTISFCENENMLNRKNDSKNLSTATDEINPVVEHGPEQEVISINDDFSDCLSFPDSSEKRDNKDQAENKIIGGDSTNFSETSNVPNLTVTAGHKPEENVKDDVIDVENVCISPTKQENKTVDDDPTVKPTTRTSEDELNITTVIGDALNVEDLPHPEKHENKPDTEIKLANNDVSSDIPSEQKAEEIVAAGCNDTFCGENLHTPSCETQDEKINLENINTVECPAIVSEEKVLSFEQESEQGLSPGCNNSKNDDSFVVPSEKSGNTSQENDDVSYRISNTSPVPDRIDLTLNNSENEVITIEDDVPVENSVDSQDNKPVSLSAIISLDKSIEVHPVAEETPKDEGILSIPQEPCVASAVSELTEVSNNAESPITVLKENVGAELVDKTLVPSYEKENHVLDLENTIILDETLKLDDFLLVGPGKDNRRSDVNNPSSEVGNSTSSQDFASFTVDVGDQNSGQGPKTQPRNSLLSRFDPLYLSRTPDKVQEQFLLCFENKTQNVNVNLDFNSDATQLGARSSSDIIFNASSSNAVEVTDNTKNLSKSVCNEDLKHLVSDTEEEFLDAECRSSNSEPTIIETTKGDAHFRKTLLSDIIERPVCSPNPKKSEEATTRISNNKIPQEETGIPSDDNLDESSVVPVAVSQISSNKVLQEYSEPSINKASKKDNKSKVSSKVPKEPSKVINDKVLQKSNNIPIERVSQETNTISNNLVSKEVNTDLTAKIMADVNDKFTVQEEENAELKLQLNASQQVRATLELQLRQKEEIIIKSQAETMRRDQTYKQEIKQLKEKLEEKCTENDNTQMKDLQETAKSLKAREAKLISELNARKNDEQNYRKIMDEYEKTIGMQLSELQKLNEEHETVKRHLANLELGFSDVHQKYERSKKIIDGYKCNEDALRQTLVTSEDNVIKSEEKYESLKAHAKAQIEKSNQEMQLMRDQYETEIHKLSAIIRRLEIKNASLADSLDQKKKECSALAALCDEVTGKV